MSYMDSYRSPWMTEELDMLRRTARAFFEDDVKPLDEQAQKNHGIGKDIWKKAGDLGLLGMSLPEEYGGHGAPFACEAVVIEEQARACNTSFGFVPGAFNAANVLVDVATPEQCTKYIPQVTAGELIISVGITEPGMGSDMQGMRTKAVLDGDNYVINGQKTFMTHGEQADLCMLAARTGDGPRDVTLFFVHTKEVEGFNISRKLEKIGQNGLDTCEVFIDNVVVPKENIVGGVLNQGLSQLRDAFIKERLIIGLSGVATAERAIELTVEHTRMREMFGHTLWDFQNTRMKLAECASYVRAARCLIDTLIQKKTEGGVVTSQEAAMVKYLCTDIQCKAIDECLQLFGGYGYMAEYPIAQLYMDARIQRIYGGANEVMKEIVARKL